MKLHIKNFRSIENLDLELAPITVLYGHNGTGKSSALYAPLTLRNVVSNPARHIQEFFNYGFANLGEFNEVVFDHNTYREVALGISVEKFYEGYNPDEIGSFVKLDYKVGFQKDASGSFQLNLASFNRYREVERIILNSVHSVDFPYRENGYEPFETNDDQYFTWNGIHTAYVPFSFFEDFPRMNTGDLGYVPSELKDLIDASIEELKRVTFVPLGRGFFHSLYSLQWVSPMAATEQEMTSLIANDRHLEYAISYRMERILNREFRVRNTIGSEMFSLDSIDRKSRVGASLVNDGFGVNQLVYLLAKVLHPDAGIVCIEEPEIHLHPTAIRRLARELSAIAQEDDGKRLLISTHSEQFIVAFLALVAEGKRSPDDIAIYLVTKDGKSSEFQRQQVNEQGQIAGGLASFMEGEMEDMKALFGISGKDE